MVQVSPQSHSFHLWVESRHPCMSPRLLAIDLPVYRTRARHYSSPSLQLTVSSCCLPFHPLVILTFISALVGTRHLFASQLKLAHLETTLPRPDHLPLPCQILHLLNVQRFPVKSHSPCHRIKVHYVNLLLHVIYSHSSFYSLLQPQIILRSSQFTV